MKYRTIYWTPFCHIAETEPQKITLKLGNRQFKVILPYVQYIRTLNKLMVTFSNTKAKMGTKVYLNPLPNTIGSFVCMGTDWGYGPFGPVPRERMYFFKSMKKTIFDYWNTKFDCDYLWCDFSFLDWTKFSKEEILSKEWNRNKRYCHTLKKWKFHSFVEFLHS